MPGKPVDTLKTLASASSVIRAFTEDFSKGLPYTCSSQHAKMTEMKMYTKKEFSGKEVTRAIVEVRCGKHKQQEIVEQPGERGEAG